MASPICRSPGSATIISTTRKAWCPRSAWPARKIRDTAMQDLREIGPSFYFAPPRTLELLLTRVMIRMEDAGFAQAQAVPLFHRCGAHAMASASSTAAGAAHRPAALLARQYSGLRPAQERLGFSRVRVAYTAGEAIGPDLFNFYRSIGLNLKQLYGRPRPSSTSPRSRTAKSIPTPSGRPARTSTSASPTTARCCSSRPACSRATSRTTPRPPRR